MIFRYICQDTGMTSVFCVVDPHYGVPNPGFLLNLDVGFWLDPHLGFLLKPDLTQGSYDRKILGPPCILLLIHNFTVKSRTKLIFFFSVFLTGDEQKAEYLQ